MYFNKFPLVYNFIANSRNLPKINVKSETYSVVLIHFTRYLKSSAKKNEHKYTKEEESIILKAINQLEFSTLSSQYAVSKAKAKNLIRSRDVNGKFESLYDVVIAAELSEKLTEKFFDSIMSKELESHSDTQEDTSSNMSDPYYKKLRGKFLNPALDDITKSKLKSMLGVYISANAVSWCSIAKENYSMTDWGYHEIIVENRMRQQITEIMETVWLINTQLPEADIYVMEMPVTSLRGGGSDPNNPKILSVNLQRAQMTSMLIALLNAKNNEKSKETALLEEENNEDEFNHYVYFLRSSLSARLFELLIGNEKVSTEATINKILLDSDTDVKKSIILPKFHIPMDLRKYYTANKPGQKELLGQSLLLAMSFMHVCVFENPSVVSKLVLS